MCLYVSFCRMPFKYIYSYFICVALSNLPSAQDLSKWSLYELGTKLLEAEIKHGGLPMEVTLLAPCQTIYVILFFFQQIHLSNL